MILVVDDEPADLEMARDALIQAGYEVLTAGGYEDAIALCRQYDGLIRLLITDVAMAPIDGCELAQMATSLEPDLPVLFVSGYVGEQALQYKWQPETKSAFLRKPFSAEDLLAKVRETIRPGRLTAASGQNQE
jgi:two-component system cell cycle sensor histidine kinase/response regulator CckA